MLSRCIRSQLNLPTLEARCSRVNGTSEAASWRLLLLVLLVLVVVLLVVMVVTAGSAMVVATVFVVSLSYEQ